MQNARNSASSSVAWALLACSLATHSLADIAATEDSHETPALTSPSCSCRSPGATMTTTRRHASVVTVYWDFLRHTQTASRRTRLRRERERRRGRRRLLESGVELVTITDTDGRIVNPEFPTCRLRVPGRAGRADRLRLRRSHVWTRSAVSRRLRSFATTVDARRRRRPGERSFDHATSSGIRDDHRPVRAIPRRVRDAESSLYAACAQVGVPNLSFVLVDGIGTDRRGRTLPLPDAAAGVPFRFATAPSTATTYTRPDAGLPPARPAPTFDSRRPCSRRVQRRDVRPLRAAGGLERRRASRSTTSRPPARCLYLSAARREARASAARASQFPGIE